MKVFFDTEFTSLEATPPRGLISVGLVAEDGRSFYAELADSWDKPMCSSFVIETVLPLLDGGDCCMKKSDLAYKLKAWIDGLSKDEVVLHSDFPGIDWPWIEDVFASLEHWVDIWPKNLRRKCDGIIFPEELQRERFKLASEEYWKSNASRQHHALVDAQGLLFAWQAAVAVR